MSTYTLKSIARRGSLFAAVAVIAAAAVLPAAPAFADALNPLTERSLLLSSSAPGFQNTDGSGNPTYAPAGSGPNGEKTGETFTFTVSSSATVYGFSFQYCTTAAGLCKAPGNNDGDARGTVTDPGPPRVFDGVSTRDNNATGHPLGTSDLDVVGAFGQAAASTAPVDGEFQIFVGGTATAVNNWSMTARNAEDAGYDDSSLTEAHEVGLTGKNNYITLSSATGIALTAGEEVRIVFDASGSNYITNPGYGSFFVKINTYDTDAEDTAYTDSVPLATNTNVVDGGVTVANVMTDSIHIVTKVLETMSFSVGIQNPDTTDKDAPANHGTCSPISQTNTITGLTNNRLNLGNPNAEYSLETGKAWDVYSYWRLSSNSSGGATVYYSGDTLRNTSGDFIAEIGAAAETSLPGTEQFGLAFVDATASDLNYWQPSKQGYVGDSDNDFWVDTNENGAVDGGDTGLVVTGAPDYRLPSLYVLSEEPAYAGGTGTIDDGSGGGGTAAFAFESASLTVPALIASNNSTVISCDTAKMRYVGNIAADTPAGVYTTKINYLAAPQY